MKLTVVNDAQLSTWLDERRIMGHDVYSIKGVAPTGATFIDGDLITMPVNIAWRDSVSGEVFNIEYKEAT